MSRWKTRNHQLLYKMMAKIPFRSKWRVIDIVDRRVCASTERILLHLNPDLWNIFSDYGSRSIDADGRVRSDDELSDRRELRKRKRRRR